MLTRLSRFLEHGVGRFTDADVRFLGDIGDRLVRDAPETIADPDVSRYERETAEFRLEVGQGVLALRDRVRAVVEHGRADRVETR